MKSIYCSKKEEKHHCGLITFLKTFESLYINRKQLKSPHVENGLTRSPSMPKMIYLSPKDKKISSSITVPNDMSILDKTTKFSSTFSISISKSASNGTLNDNYAYQKSPEKYFSPLKSNWKAIDNIVNVKNGRSSINLRSSDNTSKERQFEINEAFNNTEISKVNEKKKFNKKFLKLKLSKFFKSTGKLNEKTHGSEVLPLKETTRKSVDSGNTGDLPNDALRNLSFTAAMMAKDTKLSGKLEKLGKNNKEIPSSTLQFWKKPSEEKIKANQRRTQDNLYGSNDVILRKNPVIDNAKISSELSLFSADLIPDHNDEFKKICTSDVKGSVIVSSYDKAFQRYRNIVSQSQRLSRKDRTLSVTYDSENINRSSLKMRSCQSSGNVNMLSKHALVPNITTGDVFRKSSHSEIPRMQCTPKMCPVKRVYVLNQYNKTNVMSISPPAYEKISGNYRRAKSKLNTLVAPSPFQPKNHIYSRMQSVDISSKTVPKPPPRSDSLIRSFELICKNLQASITEPRGDSFKIFKNQNDYQAWLKNLPYHNPKKISTLLRLRSKVARRQCVSELINVNISDLNLDSKRRYSWPLLKRTDFPLEKDSTKRSNSLCRVKLKTKLSNDFKPSVDSPSLCNYSRLYCLKKSGTTQFIPSVKTNSIYKLEPINKLRSAMPNVKTSAFTSQNQRSAKYRQRQESISNSRMAASYHELDRSPFE